MAYVITVATQKGGAGKTMLATNLAVCWADRVRVVVLDIDPQRSLSRWHALRAQAAPDRPAIHLSEVAGWRLAAELDRLRLRFDIVIVDTPPQIEMDARLAIRGADLVLVPVQPSLADLWATEGTLKLAVAEHRVMRLVANRTPTSGALRDRILGEMEGLKVRRLVSILGNRVGYANAFAQGLGVTELTPKSAAAAEMKAMAAEIDAMRS